MLSSRQRRQIGRRQKKDASRSVRRTGRLERLELRQLLTAAPLAPSVEDMFPAEVGRNLEHLHDHDDHLHDHHELDAMHVGEVDFITEPREPDFLLQDSIIQMAADDGTGVALAPLEDTFLLHSNPQANHTIYLDFDGHVTTGTRWNNNYGIATINSPAYDPAGNGASFNTSEQRRVQRIWQRVAEDFAPFDVNVTTEDPGAADLIKSGGGDTRWGTRVVITRDTFANCGCGGHAFIGSFNAGTDTPVFVYNSSEIGVSAASSHEVGHALYLEHDGSPGRSYYGGHGDGETGWGPIMGSGYYENVTTWDNGSYTGANNTGSSANYGRGEDDVAVITTYNGFGFRADDHGDSATTATPVDVLGPGSGAGILNIQSFGVISTPNDVDMFSFTTGAGTVDLAINSYYARSFASNGDGTFTTNYESTPFNDQGSNLDVLARLHDSSGAVIATSNPNGLSASFNDVELEAGTYFLSVDGVGFGDWTADPPSGYGNYASLGQYLVSGTVRQVSGDGSPTAANDSAATETGVPVEINVLGNDSDPDGDALSVTNVSDATNGATVLNSDGSITYTSNAGFTGNDSFTYTISDGNGGTDTASVNVTVSAGNGAPTAVGDAMTTVEGTVVVISVLANDSDPDGDTLSVTSVTDPAGGTAAVNNNGTISYTPDSGFTGDDIFDYTISDGNGGIDTASVSVTVTADDGGGGGVTTSTFTSDEQINISSSGRPRITSTIEVSGMSGAIADLNLGFDINHTWASDLDVSLIAPNGTTINLFTDVGGSGNNFRNTVLDDEASTAINRASAPFTGTFRPENQALSTVDGITPNGAWTLVIQDDANADGGSLNSWFLEITTDGAEPNTAPVAADDQGTGTEDSVITIDVLANDSDSDGDPLSVSSITQGSSGAITITADGMLVYTPTANFNGNDSFTYTVSDGRGGEDTAAVNVTIDAVNDAPVAAGDSATTAANTAVSISVLDNDSDLDGDTLTVSEVTQGSDGTVVDSGDGVLTYTPNAGFSGSDSFTYTIADGNGGTDTGTVDVTVSPAGGGGGVTNATFTSEERINISSSGRPRITSAIEVSGMSGLISDLNLGFDLNHTWASDLDVSLIAPNGTTVNLFTDVGGAGNNFRNTVLDDEASTAINRASAPFAGTFRPENQLLSTIDGIDPNGTWTLVIQDDASADGGSLNGWSLEIATDEGIVAEHGTGMYPESQTWRVRQSNPGNPNFSLAANTAVAATAGRLVPGNWHMFDNPNGNAGATAGSREGEPERRDHSHQDVEAIFGQSNVDHWQDEVDHWAAALAESAAASFALDEFMPEELLQDPQVCDALRNRLVPSV